MESDGVSISEMAAVLEAAGHALAQRERPPEPVRLC